jgi:hypothetical protein
VAPEKSRLLRLYRSLFNFYFVSEAAHNRLSLKSLSDKDREIFLAMTDRFTRRSSKLKSVSGRRER